MNKEKMIRFIDKIKVWASKWLCFEKSKKTRNMFIFRAAIFLLLIIIFFVNTDLYYKATKKTTTFYAARALLIVPLSVFFTFLPLVKLKLPQRAVYTTQLLSIAGTMFFSLWAGEHVFKYNWREILLTPIIFNFAIMFAIFTVVYLISNRMKLGVLSMYLFTILFAIINYYVNKFRGEAISAADIYTVGTALNVAGSYKFQITWEIFEVLFGAAMLFSVLTFLPAEHKRVSGLKRLFYIIPGAALVYLIFYTVIVAAYPLENGIKVKTFKPLKTYKTNGQLLNFFRGFYYMRVFPPEEYSKEAVEPMMESSGYVSDEATYDDGNENPNIIFVMNEALADFTWFDTVELSEDPFEYIHSLAGKDNAVLGKLDVDVFGGRTAITEYEAITGNSGAFFPANAVPYALYVRDLTPSMTWNLRDAGYSGNLAFHPYKANGYSRPRAYPNLGFEDFISKETIIDSITDADYVRGAISDSSNFKQVIKLYEETREKSKEPFFLFNVTMQNHAAYDADFDNFDQTIQPLGTFATDADFKRYINLANYSDEAFRELTEYFEKVDEPTIIVMFGDHLPSIGSDFYNKLYGKSHNSLNSYELFTYYETPLVVWANYDINKDGKLNERFKNISVNYLSSAILDIAGVPMSAYQKFLSDMQKEIPVFTAHGYLDKEGMFYETDDTGSPYYDKWVNKYHFFEYNNQFDETGNRINSFFQLKSPSNAMNSATKR